MTILWDWNGTLVADVPLVVRVNNEVFTRFGLPPTTEDEYRRLFRFPVRDYYRDMNVNDEQFPVIAAAWSQGYVEQFPGCPLSKGAADVVHRFHASGFRQVIISASKRDLLLDQVAQYPEFDGMFQEILGLSDVYATSKVALAQDFLRRDGINPKDAVFIGDSCHDAEVAAAIGVRCLLIEGGHQTRQVLETAHTEILPSLTAAADLLGA